MKSDDELAHTATAQGPARPVASPGTPLGATLGRYRLERELGAGGMGVVHAAFDPDLERRVALKVLREGIAADAEQRLLREARAMARLTHPNVVTVFEVGSDAGRDFVAMELIDGEPLADWLRAEKRPEAAIIDAFVAAGRGLAAAHAAGIVHRDFKPNNVLRSRRGRIVVTDFGLAREATDVLAATLPVDAAGARADDASGPLSGLTVPGSVLGTPAYMSPEQWTGGTVTPATDQFAYCVALWEALAGERPYRGATAEVLREQVITGPAALESARIPRRLRALLRRGLDPDPHKRWASMEVLLARIVRRQRRPGIALALATGALGLGALVAFGRGDDGAAMATCVRPAIDPATVFTPEMVARFDTVATLPGVVHTHLATWRAEREAACAAPVDVQPERLACLDRVLARTEAVVQAKLLDVRGSGLQLLAQLVDPAVCRRPDPPKLPAAYSEHLVTALALHAGATLDAAAIERTRKAAASDACAQAYLALVPDQRRQDAVEAARACGDEVAIATALVDGLRATGTAMADAEVANLLREAEQAVERVRSGELARLLQHRKAAVFLDRRRYDDALAAYDAALEGAPDDEARFEIAIEKIAVLVERNYPGDVGRAREDIARWRGVLAKQGREGAIDLLDAWDATAQWWQGDVASAHPRLVAFHRKHPPELPPGRMTGTVVDAAGRPAAGATVALGYALFGDAVGVAVPLLERSGFYRMVELVTTDAQGRFEAAYAPRCGGVMAAQRGDERSVGVPSKEGARLVLQPTSRIRGRVELGGRVGSFSVNAMPVQTALASASLIGPIRPDGGFDLGGVITGDVAIGAGEAFGSFFSSRASMQRVRVGRSTLEGVTIELPAGRTARVLVRAAAGDKIRGGIVFAIEGAFAAKRAGDFLGLMGRREMSSEIAWPVIGKPGLEIAAQFQPGDLLASFPSAPLGPATVCAFTLEPDACDEPEARPVNCAPLPANAALVTLDAPRSR